jgi:predicted transcriptional regulator
MCDPGRDTELDDRLKGVYGRMHVQAFKLASLFAALDWLDTSDEVPTVTVEHWQVGQAIAENWRLSVHRLLDQLDNSGEAVQEKRQQDRLLRSVRQSGANGVALRDLYRKLNLAAKQVRTHMQDLIRAGLVEERRMNRAEWYIATEFIPDGT